MLYMTIGIGELSQRLLRLGEFRNGSEADELRDRVGTEIYDIVLNLCDLANVSSIDLTESFN